MPVPRVAGRTSPPRRREVQRPPYTWRAPVVLAGTTIRTVSTGNGSTVRAVGTRLGVAGNTLRQYQRWGTSILWQYETRRRTIAGPGGQ
eukprot:879521-Rhodomonas_salina.3